MTSFESLVAEQPVAAGMTFFREWMHQAGNLYCRWFHHSISRPVGGKYRCWKCLRDFETDW